MRRPGDDEQAVLDRLVADPAARGYERETLYGAPMATLARYAAALARRTAR